MIKSDATSIGQVMQKSDATSIGQKSDATSIGYPESDATNSNGIVNNIIGAYPLWGKPPETGTENLLSDKFLIQDLIPLDKQKFYNYFNARTTWQKTNIDDKIELYRNTLMNYVVSRNHYTLGTDYLQLPSFEFNRKVGSQTIYGSKKRPYFTQVVECIQPQYQVITNGNNLTKKVSLVKPNYQLKQIIQLKDSKELLIAMYGDIDISDSTKVDITPVDIGSLRAYIRANENYHIQNDTIRKYREQAQQVLLIAELTNGVFPQIIKESHYGRRYYTGQSLQTMSSIVRSAALGDHYQYDLNAAVYAIKYWLCTHITDKKFTYTGEYIEGAAKFKDSIRKQIAKAVYQTDGSPSASQINTIKKTVTAIGFGATMNTRGYFDNNGIWQNTSISDIFSYTSKTTGKIVLAKDKYLRLLQHPWLKEFMLEQKLMTDIIVNWYIDNKQIDKITHSFLVDNRNSYNKNKVMAYVFQTLERGIMDKTEEFINSTSDNSVLLRVHDAIYTKKRVNMPELHTMIQQTFTAGPNNYLSSNLITFSQEKVNRYEYFEYENAEHKNFIHQEELDAAINYRNSMLEYS